jgi:hypothetical protein
LTDFPAEAAGSTSGGVVTKRTGTASSDTVPIGAVVVWVNTGAGSHTVTLGNNQLADGLAVTGRVLTIATATANSGLINPVWGDASGRVSVTISGTAAEVTYYVLGGL